MSRAQILGVSYSVWKQVVQNNGFTPYFHEDDGVSEQGSAFAGNRDYIYSTRVVDDTWEDFDTTFSGTRVDVARRDDAFAHIVGVVNVPTTPMTGDGRPRVAIEKPDSTKVTMYSHNWCDKTSWYEAAVRVVDEEAADSGDHQEYLLTNSGIIDTYHGKTMQEDFLTDGDGNSYRVLVKVDEVQKTEQDPHYGTGGDYTVDYDNGKINFLQALSGAETVEVTYHYATAATYTVKPQAGKKLIIDAVEVQLSGDVEISDTILFQPYGPVEVFAPQYCPVPYPVGTMIPLGNPLVFKSMGDYFVDANKAWPPYPAGIGGNSWRGIPADIYIFTWDYLSATELNGAYGVEIRVEMQHNEKFGGSYASASFYCRSEDL